MILWKYFQSCPAKRRRIVSFREDLNLAEIEKLSYLACVSFKKLSKNKFFLTIIEVNFERAPSLSFQKAPPPSTKNWISPRHREILAADVASCQLVLQRLLLWRGVCVTFSHTVLYNYTIKNFKVWKRWKKMVAKLKKKYKSKHAA